MGRRKQQSSSGQSSSAPLCCLDGTERERIVLNSYHFAYVTHFLNLFYPAFGLDSFSYHVSRAHGSPWCASQPCRQDLEILLLEEPDHVSGKTADFFKRILKALPNARITAYTLCPAGL